MSAALKTELVLEKMQMQAVRGQVMLEQREAMGILEKIKALEDLAARLLESLYVRNQLQRFTPEIQKEV